MRGLKRLNYRHQRTENLKSDESPSPSKIAATLLKRRRGLFSKEMGFRPISKFFVPLVIQREAVIDRLYSAVKSKL
jgi:hypothetical protein